ncbi:hypothetical protein X777_08888 [Ooceraea biroi]|uniref:Uncharacterized protein n=1 Tax=Ooceraea biroi TaxID=2015173 RepID=A0A026W8K2_OOCBI|nr:hypothetical protein X777_08888 [Ooceraea biroi]
MSLSDEEMLLSDEESALTAAAAAAATAAATTLRRGGGRSRARWYRYQRGGSSAQEGSRGRGRGRGRGYWGMDGASGQQTTRQKWSAKKDTSLTYLPLRMTENRVPADNTGRQCGCGIRIDRIEKTCFVHHAKNDSYARRTAGVTPIRVSRTVEAAPTVERAAEDMLSTSARRAAEDVRPLRRCRPSTIRPLRRRGACTIRTIHRCGVSAFGMEQSHICFPSIRISIGYDS